jgi:hypothetical protein
VHELGEGIAPAWVSWSGIVLLLGGAVWGHRVRLASRRSRPSHGHDAAGRSGRYRDPVSAALDIGPAS